MLVRLHISWQCKEFNPYSDLPMARLPRNNWSNSGRGRKSFAPLPGPPSLLMCTLDYFIRDKMELYLDFPITSSHLDIATQGGSS